MSGELLSGEEHTARGIEQALGEQRKRDPGRSSYRFAPPMPASTSDIPALTMPKLLSGVRSSEYASPDALTRSRRVVGLYQLGHRTQHPELV